MDNIRSLTLDLSANELRAMTKWPDALIEDYLARGEALNSIINNINIVIQEVTVNGVEGALGNLAAFQKSLADTNESVAALVPAGGAPEQANRIKQDALLSEQIAGGVPVRAADNAARQLLARRILELEEAVGAFATLGPRLAQLRAAVGKELADLTEQLANSTALANSLKAQLSALNLRVQDQEQMMAGTI